MVARAARRPVSWLGLGLVDAEADHEEVGVGGMRGVQLLQVGELGDAGGAPRGPIVEEDDLPFEVGEPEGAAFERLEGEVRGGIADLEVRAGARVGGDGADVGRPVGGSRGDGDILVVLADDAAPAARLVRGKVVERDAERVVTGHKAVGAEPAVVEDLDVRLVELELAGAPAGDVHHRILDLLLHTVRQRLAADEAPGEEQPTQGRALRLAPLFFHRGLHGFAGEAAPIDEDFTE